MQDPFSLPPNFDSALPESLDNAKADGDRHNPDVSQGPEVPPEGEKQEPAKDQSAKENVFIG